MLLFIDASYFDYTSLALVGKEIFLHKFEGNLSQRLLSEIKKFCKKQKINLNQIQKIAVVTGPGGFSRVRSVVAVANALAFALKIPLAGIKKSEMPSDLKKLSAFRIQKMVSPFYDREPNITLSKSKL